MYLKIYFNGLCFWKITIVKPRATCSCQKAHGREWVRKILLHFYPTLPGPWSWCGFLVPSNAILHSIHSIQPNRVTVNLQRVISTPYEVNRCPVPTYQSHVNICYIIIAIKMRAGSSVTANPQFFVYGSPLLPHKTTWTNRESQVCFRRTLPKS